MRNTPHAAFSRRRSAAVAIGAACLAIAGAAVAMAEVETAAAPCTRPLGPEVAKAAERIVEGKTPGKAGGIERTEFYPDGIYRVTRCDALGRLIVSQVVRPVPVPGGERVPLPYMKTTPAPGGHFTVYLDYGDPEDPRWSAYYRSVEDEVRASVIPPTQTGDK